MNTALHNTMETIDRRTSNFVSKLLAKNELLSFRSHNDQCQLQSLMQWACVRARIVSRVKPTLARDCAPIKQSCDVDR